MASVFLKAEWRKLILVNYKIDKAVLKRYMPSHVEMDEWNDTCYISLVGFMFLNTSIKGLKIPLHVNFEEINLRFYVKHKENGVYKRGVIFIKEIVPKYAITLVANTFYKEKYQTFRTGHKWKVVEADQEIMYEFKKDKWHTMSVVAGKEKQPILFGSEEEFITEHYWGYTKINESKTIEYAVEHPRWEMYPVSSYKIDVNFKDVYGDDFAFLEKEKPVSVMLAEGSEIIIRSGKVL
ncbi:MAG: DUF2071 domain-containing protein [Bacteroidetes bacterium]|nr:DUF2071 domain-containing protein [Bacteroidota bacterium]